MTRLLSAAALVAVFATAQPAMAQPRSAPSDVRKLESEVDKLKSVLKDIEAQLAKAKKVEAEKAKPAKRGEYEKPKFEMAKGPGRGPGGFGPGRGPGGFGPPGRSNFGPPSRSEGSEFDRRIDRLIQELEALKRAHHGR